MRIGILTSSRADYSQYLPLLRLLKEDEKTDLSIIAFGTHLSKKHGYTIDQITTDGFEVRYKIDTYVDGDGPDAICESMSKTISQFTPVWEAKLFDIAFAFGDRYEMFAAVLSSVPFNQMIGNTNSEFTCGVISFEDGIHDMIALRRSLKEGNTFKATYKKNTPEIIYSYLKDVCIKLKPYGACNFQLRIDNSGQPKIFEINARHSGTTYMRALLGFNEIEYIIEHTLKLEHKPFHLKEATVVRYFDEFVTEQ